MIRWRVDAGDIRGASRILLGNDKLAPLNEETKTALQATHPKGPTPSVSELQAASPLRLTEGQIRKAAYEMTSASAPGRDGLRISHVQQMLGKRGGENSTRLSKALDAFAELCIAGKVSKSIRPHFYGARLVALSKKDGGLRHIAVGLTLCRLVGKACCISLREKAKAVLQPHQLGVGVPGGTEAAAHATRLFLTNSGKGLVKLVFRNAFNELDRSVLINAVDRLIPELGLFVRSCYVEPSTLDLDGHTILSQRGVQQGDPFGPLLFAIGIKQLSSASRC